MQERGIKEMYMTGWDPDNSTKHKGDSEHKINQHV